jgi:hypothetical protein
LQVERIRFHGTEKLDALCYIQAAATPYRYDERTTFRAKKVYSLADVLILWVGTKGAEGRIGYFKGIEILGKGKTFERRPTDQQKSLDLVFFQDRL